MISLIDLDKHEREMLEWVAEEHAEGISLMVLCEIGNLLSKGLAKVTLTMEGRALLEEWRDHRTVDLLAESGDKDESLQHRNRQPDVMGMAGAVVDTDDPKEPESG
jgi:hypothetical protein